MSANIVNLASHQPSSEPSSEAVPDLIHDASQNLDVEMTAPLTSMDGLSTTSSSSLSGQSKEMNPFQSAKDRVDRLNCSRSSMAPPNPNPFSTTPWRRDQAASAIVNTDRPNTNPLANVSNRARSQSMMSVEGVVPLSSVKPGPVWPTENQLMVAYTYGIRRDDGTYTRLIPADELNELSSGRIPVNQGPEGMIVLPPTLLPRPEKRMGAEEMISNNVSPELQICIPANFSQLVNSLPLNQPRRPRRSNVPDPNDETQVGDIPFPRFPVSTLRDYFHRPFSQSPMSQMLSVIAEANRRYSCKVAPHCRYNRSNSTTPHQDLLRQVDP
jgi:hypothetical protein